MRTVSKSPKFNHSLKISGGSYERRMAKGLAPTRQCRVCVCQKFVNVGAHAAANVDKDRSSKQKRSTLNFVRFWRNSVYIDTNDDDYDGVDITFFTRSLLFAE